MPPEWHAIRQAHKHHLAGLFDRIADRLESGLPLADMAAALDLMAYEQGYSTILGLTRAEDLALRALGEGGLSRFSVGFGSNLWFERESSGPLAAAHPAKPTSPPPPQ
jgi:hypothetical protein